MNFPLSSCSSQSKITALFRAAINKKNITLGQCSLIYINDLHKAIRYYKEHQFADDTNLFHTNKSLKNLNKLVNHDMKQLKNWLSANKTSLNIEKTKLVVFKSPRKVLSDEIKVKLTGKRLYPSNSVKSLGVNMINFYTDMIK